MFLSAISIGFSGVSVLQATEETEETDELVRCIPHERIPTTRSAQGIVVAPILQIQEQKADVVDVI